MNRSLKMTYTTALLTVDDDYAASVQLSGRNNIPQVKGGVTSWMKARPRTRKTS
ncbi:MAG TPA: hypothetical protein VFO99_07355 [Pyrinomonadaceae bacterium]|nr:hypothetical protein [Pyrinomonadaceae bacterium]